MTTPPGSPTRADGGATAQPSSTVAAELRPQASVGATTTSTLTPSFADFATALNGALRDFHRPDLLGRNPLLQWGSGYLGPSAGPPELQALLFETAGTLFA